jgi:hypothetical protein
MVMPADLVSRTPAGTPVLAPSGRTPVETVEVDREEERPCPAADPLDGVSSGAVDADFVGAGFVGAGLVAVADGRAVTVGRDELDGGLES